MNNLTYAQKHWEPQGVTVTSYQDQVYNDMVVVAERPGAIWFPRQGFAVTGKPW